MDNLSQDNFDDLFRESSEKVDFEYREDAWTALDGMLEEKEKKRRWLWILLGISLSTFLVVGLFYFSKDTPVQVSTNEVVEQMTEENQSVESNENSVSSDFTPSDKKADNITSKPASSNANNSKVKQNLSSSSPIKTTEKQTREEAKNEVITAKENIAQYHTTTIKNKLITSDNSIPEKTINKAKLESIATLLSPITIPSQVIDFDIDSISTGENPKKSNHLSFGLFGSLDYSSLALTQEKSTQGYRFGVRTDYNFARRFSIGLGVAFSRKAYTASGTRYNAKPGFWTEGVAPTELDGFCNIIEIPLELRYYVKGFQQDGFFVGAGLNSYYMALEQYEFRYTDLRDDAILDWEERGTNTHLLAIGTFTAGYQKRLSKKFAIQIAPYINLPLKGIGQGGVSLQSAGINIGFKWQ